MSYPFDPTVRQYVADLLFNLLPSLYQIQDLPQGATQQLKTAAPPGTEELYKFVYILAAPLAEVRENIDELQADLFIDKCADWVLPYLAQMIGMNLVFPDAASNRVDVRGTVGWRRQKGTPSMLQDMGSQLSREMVVTEEGFKRILLSQDYNLLRPTRTIGQLGPAIIAEQGTGPLDATFHAVDPRRISLTTGRYHPKQIAHWTHPTQLFPLREGTAFARPPSPFVVPPSPSDLRYAFDPLGVERQIRVRRAAPDDPIQTDRVFPMHFAASPGDYFDQTGTSNARFTVRIDGLPGGVATPAVQARFASAIPAYPSLAGALVTVTVLEQTVDRLTSNVDVEVFAVPLTGAASDTPNTAAAQPRGGARITTGGTSTPITPSFVAVAAPFVAMLHLQPVAPATAAYFPGATIEIAGQAIDAGLAAADSGLAALGFLGGAFVVDVPATWVRGERWLYLAADGSVYDAQSPLAPPPGGGALELPGNALTVGPGPAWPPLPPTATPDPWQGMPSAVARGPVAIHGAPALLAGGAGYSAVGASVSLGLVFALVVGDQYTPFLRLDWKGGDPTSATRFSVLEVFGALVIPAATVSAIQSALNNVETLVDDAITSGQVFQLFVRLEADDASIVLPPCEVVYASATGAAVLIHLPQLETGSAGISSWGPSLAAVSDPVTVSADGSTYFPNSLQILRYAYGSIAPIRQAASLRRRTVRQRTLCSWDNEDATHMLAPTPPGYLDVDPLYGLFAIAAAEPAPTYTTSIEGLPPPAPVTVDYQEGYSYDVGARPDAREPLLDAQLPAPTRLVVGAGRFDQSPPAGAQTLPRYATLSAALADVQANGPVSGELDTAGKWNVVIQIEDSATYAEPALIWPTGLQTLTIQAAEFERPVLVFNKPWPLNPPAVPPVYTSLTLLGLVLATSLSVNFPQASTIDVQFCTVTQTSGLLHFDVPPGAQSQINVLRSLTGPIRVDGEGTVSITGSVVDAAGGMSISAPGSTVQLTHTTVASNTADLAALGGWGTQVRVLDASESIFTDLVDALDRFHGCIRYSRAPTGSLLPRRHRVVEDNPSFVTRDRTDPAHMRLSEQCPQAVLRGAEDGSEMGAFHDVMLAQRDDALLERLIEYTPAGLDTGILRLD